MSKKILSIKNLFVKDYKQDKIILKDISFDVDYKDIFIILGKNGSGKSTLALAIVNALGDNLIKEGNIFFEGKDISNLPINKIARLGISILWQNFPNIEELSVKDYLELSLHDEYRKKSEYYIKKFLSMVDLPYEEYKDRPLSKNLSGGERKRIEIASILCAKPKLVILDEPDTALDYYFKSKLKDIIDYLNKNGSTILLITHNENLLNIANKGILLCNGTIKKRGSIDTLKEYYINFCNFC